MILFLYTIVGIAVVAYIVGKVLTRPKTKKDKDEMSSAE